MTHTAACDLTIRPKAGVLAEIIDAKLATKNDLEKNQVTYSVNYQANLKNVFF